MSVLAGERPATLLPLADWPTNRGGLCSKGWTAAALLDHPERLTRPLVRAVPGDRRSPLIESTWAEALHRITAAIVGTQQVHGRDAVGLFGGGGLTNEKAYALGKFARVALRTSAIDYNGRFCMSSAAVAANRTFGIDRGLPFPLADLEQSEVVLLAGSNPAETMPPAMQFFDAGRAKGAQHIVVDPRATATACGSALHLQITPGTDLALANGLLHLAIRGGLIDDAYIAERTAGFDAVRAAVSTYWPDFVERLTGVPVHLLHRTVELLASARTAVILTARGVEQHRTGTDAAQAWINLALALGLPGRPFSGLGDGDRPGQRAGRSRARAEGRPAARLPAAARPGGARARRRASGESTPRSLPGPGRSAFEMLDALGTPGGVRTLLVFASNIAVSAPDTRRITKRLGQLDFLAVSDLFLSETAALADVVLPTAQWAEEDGTLTNLEGRVIRRRKALSPPAGVRDDLTVIADLAAGLGRGEHFSADPRAVFDELRRASAGGIADYAGISYERIDAEQGVFWPCPSADHPGTPRLFRERFATTDGRARFLAVKHRQIPEQPSAAFPYLLTTGRVMGHYQSGAQTRKVPALLMNDPDPFVELHPDLARRLGIAAGDTVELRSRRGCAVFRARLSDAIRPDTVFAPFHWGGRFAANALTDPRLDRSSKMPNFKVCAVAIQRAGDSEALGTADAPARTTLPDDPRNIEEAWSA